MISDTAWSEGISNITVPMDILLNGTNEQEFRIGGDEPFIYPEYGGSVVGLFLWQFTKFMSSKLRTAISSKEEK